MKERIISEILKIKREFYDTLKKQGEQKIIAYLYIIFSLIAITIFGLFAIRPTLSTISELQKEKKDSEFTLEQLEIKNQALQKLSAEYRLLEPKLDSVYLAIPKSSQIPDLARKFEVVANGNNLFIEALTTGPIEIFPAVKSNPPLFSYNITITVIGNNTDINSFIQDIVNIDRMLSIDRISSGKAERNQYTATLTGRAFFFKE